MSSVRMKEEEIVEYLIIAFISVLTIVVAGAICELYLHWSCGPEISSKNELNDSLLDALEGTERMDSWIHHVGKVQVTQMENKSE